MGVAARTAIDRGRRTRTGLVPEGQLPVARRDRAARTLRPLLSRALAQPSPAGSSATRSPGVRARTGEPELWVVNTLFSCLATLHPDYSFVPRWRPPFVSELAGRGSLPPERDSDARRPAAFVTAMAQSDEARRLASGQEPDGGCILDVASGEPVTNGLAMPHSPRWHRGSAARAQLRARDARGGRPARAAIGASRGGARVYARGSPATANLAFVGLSRIRETAVFGGVPIAERHEDLKCGVGVIDLTHG